MIPEALVLSGCYRFQIRYRPFAALAEKIGVQGYETPAEDDSSAAVLPVRAVAEAVCRHTPWESKCLVRALTAKKMLNRRGYACTLYMGVALGKDGQMEAHAWLRCGSRYVVGGNGDGFAITGIFGDEINQYWLALLLAEIYSFSALFMSMSNSLKNFYPITAVFGVSGYYETTVQDLTCCIITLSLCGCLAAVLLVGLNHSQKGKMHEEKII